MQKPTSPSRRERDDRRRHRRRRDRQSAEFWQALYPERRQSDRRGDTVDVPVESDAESPNTDVELADTDPASPDMTNPTSPGAMPDVFDVRDSAGSDTDAIGDRRRDALLSMLAAAEARHAAASRRRRPALAAGVRVRVVSGTYVGDAGVVLDADYIHARVQVDLADERVPQWVDFDQVVAQPDDGVAP